MKVCENIRGPLHTSHFITTFANVEHLRGDRYVSDRGIVLGYTRVGETAVVVDCLTLAGGRRGLLTGAGGASHRKSLAKLLPLTELEFTLDNHAKGGLPRMHEARMTHPFRHLPFEQRRREHAFDLCQTLRNLLYDGQPDSLLYNTVLDIVRQLDNDSKPDPTCTVRFLYNLTKPLGIQPQLRQSSKQQFFDLDNGEWLTYPPLRTAFIYADQANAFDQLQRGELLPDTPHDLLHDLEQSLRLFLNRHLKQ